MKPQEIKDKVLSYFIERAKKSKDNSITFDSTAEFKTALGYEPDDQFILDILNSLQKDGYLNVENFSYQSSYYTVLLSGFEFMKNGGYTALHKEKEKQRDAVENEQKLTRWKVKWFWVSQAIAITALVISLCALFK